MRLAFTHAYSWPDVRRGGERYVHELARAMVACGHDVTFLTAGRVGGREVDHGVKIVRLQRRFNSAPRHEAEFAVRIAPRLWAGRFDAVHSLGLHDAIASIWTKRLGAGHRTVYTNLGIPLRVSPWAQPSRLHMPVVKAIDVYGCLSAYAENVLRADWGRSGVRTPGGVNLATFSPAPARAAEPTVLFSGAVSEPRKGLAVLLDAFAIVVDAVPDVRLWISGPGDATPLLAPLRDEVRTRVDVLPLGDPDEQRDRYGTAWVTAVPSKSEAFGLVALEAMACGTPVVASTDAGLPELIDAGVTGYLARPDDPDEIAAQLVQALDLARHPTTVDACRRAAARHDWAVLAPHYEELYRG